MIKNTYSKNRIVREQEYHNHRFSEETRIKQKKYYYAVKDLFDSYSNKINQLSYQKSVLEYGCGRGEISINLHDIAKKVTGIDISSVAIEKAQNIITTSEINNIDFHVMNAEQLDFPDNSFDFVFGSGILHHLDIYKAYYEISRVLKPNGIALFIEPLGHNPIINAYRKSTPYARTDDEHPLLFNDIHLAEKYFSKTTFSVAGLTTLATVPFQKTSLNSSLYDLASKIDRNLFKLPYFRKMAWFSLITFQK